MIYENGKRYDLKYRDSNASIWTTQINHQRKNSLYGQEPYIMNIHAMLLFSMYTDSLEKYLEGGEGGIPFQAQMKDLRASMDKTILQLVSGESPELNTLIEEIVLKKIEDLSLTKVEAKPEVKEPQKTTLPAVDRITNLMLRAENIHLKTQDVNVRNQQMKDIFSQIEAINKELKMYTSEYEMIQQMISLFNTIYSQRS